jgi:hypothetical protein
MKYTVLGSSTKFTPSLRSWIFKFEEILFAERGIILAKKNNLIIKYREFCGD